MVIFFSLSRRQSKTAPVWVKATIYEVSTTGIGISSGKSHFVDRSNCLSVLKETMKQWDWPLGKQKTMRVSIWDLKGYWWDMK